MAKTFVFQHTCKGFGFNFYYIFPTLFLLTSSVLFLVSKTKRKIELIVILQYNYLPSLVKSSLLKELGFNNYDEYHDS